MKTRLICSLLAITALAVWGCTKPDAPQIVATPSNTTHGEDGHTHGDDGHSHDDGHDHDGHDHDGHDHDDDGHKHDDDHEHGDGDHEHGDAASSETVEVSLVFCGSCGDSFDRTSTHRCAEDQAKCETCGLHKGSALCCKLEGDFTGQLLCGNCGQVAGTDACCKEGAEVCAKCNLHKGAALCCKLAAKAEEERKKQELMD